MVSGDSLGYISRVERLLLASSDQKARGVAKRPAMHRTALHCEELNLALESSPLYVKQLQQLSASRNLKIHEMQCFCAPAVLLVLEGMYSGNDRLVSPTVHCLGPGAEQSFNTVDLPCN